MAFPAVRRSVPDGASGVDQIPVNVNDVGGGVAAGGVGDGVDGGVAVGGVGEVGGVDDVGGVRDVGGFPPALNCMEVDDENSVVSSLPTQDSIPDDNMPEESMQDDQVGSLYPELSGQGECLPYFRNLSNLCYIAN